MNELLDTLLFTVGDARVTVGVFLLIVTVIVLTFLIGQALRRLVRLYFEKEHKAEPGAFQTYGVVAQLLVWLIGLDIVLHLLGIRLTSLLAASGFIAIGAGFAAKNIIENFLSGLILRFEKTVRPGDVLLVAGEWRVVRLIGIRATEAKTFEGEDVFIPNSILTKSTVQNLTRTDRAYRLSIKIGVAYESDQAVVKQTLEETVRGLTWRSQRKDYSVKLWDFSESSVVYWIMVWIDNVDDALDRRADLLEAIWAAFREKDITIAYRQLDVHLDATRAGQPDQDDDTA